MSLEPSEPPRRFYKEVTLEPRPQGVAVLLDGRALKTPAKQLFLAPTQAAAELAAAEWASQGERILPAAMPVTRLLNVALDRAPETRAALAAEVARYAETDLLCHLADEASELREREEANWAPLRAWAAETLGVRLEPVAGVVARPQRPESLAAAHDRALALDDVRLVTLAHATALLGSVILGFALVNGRLGAEAAFAASRIDETYQEEQWGADAEASERAEGLREELVVIEALLAALDRG